MTGTDSFLQLLRKNVQQNGKNVHLLCSVMLTDHSRNITVDIVLYYNAWQDGFVKYDEKFPGQRTLADIDHCRVVLRWG